MKRANIKISRDLFDELQDEKGDMTWDSFLRDRCLDDRDVTLQDVIDEVGAIPDRTAAEIERRMH